MIRPDINGRDGWLVLTSLTDLIIIAKPDMA
jgi:hypothetical protein